MNESGIVTLVFNSPSEFHLKFFFLLFSELVQEFCPWKEEEEERERERKEKERLCICDILLEMKNIPNPARADLEGKWIGNWGGGTINR